jgi:hypothetical protein
VPYVTLNVRDERNMTIIRITGGMDGIVLLMLETGSYTCEAIYKSEIVGKRSMTVTGVALFDLTCNLTNLLISVVAFKDSVAVGVPDVRMFVAPVYLELFTDVNGTVIVHSLLPNHDYTVNAYRYNVQFNVITIPGLFVGGSPVPWFYATVVCPNLKLIVNVTDVNSQPISGITVIAKESIMNLTYQSTTNQSGQIAFHCVLGKYNLTVYDPSNNLLNQTIIQLLNLSSSETKVTLGTRIIPEFPSILIVPVLLATTLPVIITRRKKRAGKGVFGE